MLWSVRWDLYRVSWWIVRCIFLKQMDLVAAGIEAAKGHLDKLSSVILCSGSYPKGMAKEWSQLLLYILILVYLSKEFRLVVMELIDAYAYAGG